MIEKTNIDPDFHSFTTDQTLFSTEGTSHFSLRLTPSTAEHFKERVEPSGRTRYVDITAKREVEAADIARIDMEYETPRLVESADGRIVELREVNKDASAGNIGMMTPWSTDGGWNNSKQNIQALALAYPDYKVTYITTPGMGESSRISADAAKAMRKTGSYIPMAQQVAAVLHENGIEFSSLVGMSEGGRLAIALGAELAVDRVITLDPPGMRGDWSILGFGKHFTIDEGNAMKELKRFSADTEAVYEHDYRDRKYHARGAKALGRQLPTRAVAMSKNGLVEDILAATSKGVQIVDYRAGASTIGGPAISTELAEKTPGYNAVVLNNAPHAFSEMNPFGIALLVEQANALLDGKGDVKELLGSKALLT